MVWVSEQSGVRYRTKKSAERGKNKLEAHYKKLWGSSRNLQGYKLQVIKFNDKYILATQRRK